MASCMTPLPRPPRHGHTSAQLALGFTQVCASPSEPSHTDTVQGQRGRGTGPASCAVLAHSDLVFGTHAPRDSPSWRIPLRKHLLCQGPGTMWHPRPDTWTAPGASEALSSSLSVMEVSRKGRLSPSRGWLTG